MKSIHLLSVSVLLLAACKESTPSSTSRSDDASPEVKASIERVLDAVPETQAVAIKDAKTSAKPGDEITVTGRIMGHANPFVEGRAAFILADPSLITACSDNPGDGCKTPWDACCDTPEAKKKAIATIQIVDADGRVLKHHIEGLGGITKLAHVTVSGKVADGSQADLLIINASAIQPRP